MRKTLLLFIVASLGFMVSCTSKEEKMQGLAKDYVAEQLKTYEQLTGKITIDKFEFGDVDSLFESYDETKEGKVAKERVDPLKSVYEKADDPWLPSTETSRKRASETKRAYDMEQLQYCEKELAFKGSFKGWKLKTIISYYNSGGKAEQDSMFVFFSPEKDKVIGAKSLKSIAESKKATQKLIDIIKDIYKIK